MRDNVYIRRTGKWKKMGHMSLFTGTADILLIYNLRELLRKTSLILFLSWLDLMFNIEFYLTSMTHLSNMLKIMFLLSKNALKSLKSYQKQLKRPKHFRWQFLLTSKVIWLVIIKKVQILVWQTEFKEAISLKILYHLELM